MRLIIGMSDASGVIYGIRLLEVLNEVAEVETHLVMSESAKMNIAIETDWAAKDVKALADHVHSNKDIAASIASGSFRLEEVRNDVRPNQAVPMEQEIRNSHPMQPITMAFPIEVDSHRS